MNACAAVDLRSVVIRARDFYGVGSGSWLYLVVLKSNAQGGLVCPRPPRRAARVGLRCDLAGAFDAVAWRADASAAPVCEHFHFDGHKMTGHDLLTHLEQATEGVGVRHRAQLATRRAALPTGRSADLVHPLSREIAGMSYLWRVPHALDGQALDPSVGPLAATTPAVARRAALLGPRFRRCGPAAHERCAADPQPP